VFYICGSAALTVTAGFGAQIITDDGRAPCGGTPTGCVPVAAGVSGACGSGGFWVVVERLDGGCGPFTLEAI
jgi:hypothetical protein